jgi:hypothetical protein
MRKTTHLDKANESLKTIGNLFSLLYKVKTKTISRREIKLNFGCLKFLKGYKTKRSTKLQNSKVTFLDTQFI